MSTLKASDCRMAQVPDVPPVRRGFASGQPLLQLWLPWSHTLLWLFSSSTTHTTLSRPVGGPTQSFAASATCVAVLTVTLQLPFFPRSPNEQLSVCELGTPTETAVTVQLVAPLCAPVQLTVGLVGPQFRLPLGSGSVSAGLKCTLWAVPSPSLVTTTVKKIVSPGLYVPLSGVFWIVRCGSPMIVTGSDPVPLHGLLAALLF